jgi:hypothetical protein
VDNDFQDHRLRRSGYLDFLFVRSIFFRRSTRLNERFKEFKKQSDVAVLIFLFLIACVVIVAVAKLVWAWL